MFLFWAVFILSAEVINKVFDNQLYNMFDLNYIVLPVTETLFSKNVLIGSNCKCNNAPSVQKKLDL